MPFLTKTLDVTTQDGRNCFLLSELVYQSNDGKTYIVPIGAATDGASTPQMAWSVGLPPFGKYWLACVLHDAAYRNTLLCEGSKANLTKEQSDLLLKEAMKSSDVDDLDLIEIYAGVKFGGWKAFKDDRK